MIRRTEIKTYDGLAAFSCSSHSSTSLHGGDAVELGSCTVVAATEVEAIVLARVAVDGQGTWPRFGPQPGPGSLTAVVDVVGFPVVVLLIGRTQLLL